MDHLERQYLLTAYQLARADPMHVFDEGEVANHVDLDPSEPGFADRFISLTRYHLDKGFVASISKGGGMGNRSLRLTPEGLEMGERLANPIEQRKEQRRRFLRAIYVLADGNPAEFVYWPALAPEMGWDPENAEHKEQGIALAEYAERARLITIEVDEGTVYRITEKGVDEVEENRPEPQQNVSNVFNMSGNFYQAAVGTHNTNTFTGDLDFSTVERRIEEEGGPDKEELRELVREMRELLESGQTLDKGFLARFNDKLKEHGWLSGAVAGWLLNFATQ